MPNLNSNNNQKIWQLPKEITKDFLQKYPRYPRVVLQLLQNRGIVRDKDIRNFLNPEYSLANNPFLFSDMGKAVDLIIEHIKKQNKIVVFGDYDADGVTASAVLTKTLSILRAQVDIYIPYRATEGYGLNKKAIKYIVDQGAKLIITVDTGIRNKQEVGYAQDLGLEVIVTDHHSAPDNSNEWPNCLIINPILASEKYPFKFLAGVGVAFKLAAAIISRAKLDKKIKFRLEQDLLDLVAIGTVADCVSLLDENRVLVKTGLEKLNHTKRLGIKELIKIAGIKTENKIDAWNIGFQIAPRLNAAGRLDHANTAFELLVTGDEKEASELARRLNNKNIERQNITEEIMVEVEEQIKPQQKERILIGISQQEKAWNEGVIGLVAGRITEKYYKPTLIISCAQDCWRGSGRSIEEFNLIKAIGECQEFLIKYGGHRLACGFGIKEKNLDKFVAKMRKIALDKLEKVKLKPKLKIETELDLEEITEELIEQINTFAPFGQDNPRPIFLSREVNIVDTMTMGSDDEHIKLKLQGQSRLINAVGFYQSERWKKLKLGDVIDIVYYLDINKFNGYSEPQIKIIDICQKN